MLLAKHAVLATSEPEKIYSPSPVVKVAYEVSDLVYYFESGNTPTGIQRVQQEICLQLIEEPAGPAVSLVIYDIPHQRWRAVPQDWMRGLISAARCVRNGVDVWSEIYSSFVSKISSFSFHQFESGDWLVNVGASWALPSYFIHVRHLRRRGVRFSVYLHDCIPLRHPSYFEYEHTIEHTFWLSQIRETANIIFCNSEATRRDYIQLVKPNSNQDVVVNRLDASWVKATGTADDDIIASDLLADNGVFDDDFVLCVGTIEPRKNHLTLIHVWDKLRHTHPSSTPKLVCVGRIGWKSDAAIAQAKALSLLGTKIFFLGAVADDLLASLYRKCRLTIYLSYYEGWGLPISESLAAGKVCVAGTNSSLIEAGAGLACHVDERSETSVHDALGRFIDDPDSLREAEVNIEKHYRPRSWGIIADDLFDTLASSNSENSVGGLPILEINKLYSFGREKPIQHFEQPWSAEPYCVGTSWYQSESWGVWTSREASELGFRVSKTHQRPLLFLGLVAPPDGCDITIFLNGEMTQVYSNVIGRKNVRINLDQLVSKSSSAHYVPVRLRTLGSRVKKMADDENVSDMRTLGIGFSFIIGFDQNSILERIEFLEMLIT